MLKNIILTKIVAPKLHSKILLRDRIKQILTGNYTKIWSIIADSGYGKTTCLLELITYINFPSVWYSLNNDDNDINTFINYLTHSIQRIYPDYGKTIINLQTHADCKELDIKTIFLNELITLKKELLIIFDNYHKIINNEIINDFIQFLINYLPPNVYLAITSRTELPFDFNNFFSIGQIVNITTKDLKFTLHETHELCKFKQIELFSQINDILKPIDGWVTGLLLFIQNITKSFDKDKIDMDYFKDLTQTTINKYFRSEIMNFLPEDICNFLCLSSILEVFDMNMCQDIFNVPKDNLVKYFKYIEENNIFIDSYFIQEKIFYKYQELFRQFLLKELENQYSSEDIKNLYKKIGDYYVHQKLNSFAITHYLLANEFKLALELIEKNWDIYLHSRENNLIVEKWLNEFPEDMLLTNAFLLHVQGKIALAKDDVNKAINFYKQAEKLYRQSNDYINLFRINCTLAILFFNDFNDIKKSKKYLSKAKLYQHYVPLEEQILFLFTEAYCAEISQNIYKALKILNQICNYTNLSHELRNNFVLIVSMNRLGMIYRSIGEIDKAIISLNKALKETKNGNDNYTYYIKSNLAESYLFKGNIEAGLSLIKEIEKWINKGNFILANDNDNLIVINLCKCLLYFDEEEKIQNAKNYLNQSYNYLMNTARHENSIEVIFLKNLSAIIACKENLFSYAINLHKEIINKYIKNSFLKASFFLDYIRTLLVFSNFEETIKVAQKYLEKDNFSYTYQKLQAQIYVCTAYLKYGKTDDGINLLKLILDECYKTNNEYLIIIYPKILETLLPVIFQINETMAISLWEKVLQIYKCNIKPYLLSSAISSLPALAFYENETLLQQLKSVLNQQSFLLIRTFGYLEVKTYEGMTLQWQRQGTKKLLALLLLYPEGIFSDKLNEILFCNKETKTESNLRKLVHYLRELLEPDIEKSKESSFIIYKNGKYKFNFESNYYLLDLKEFLLHYQRGLTALKENNINLTYIEYKKAVDFYRGNLLEDIDLLEIETIRESYWNKCSEMLLFLCEYSFNNHKFEDCIDYSKKNITHDKYEEQAYCYLMKCYFKKGRKDLIKEQYYRCKKNIEEELEEKLSQKTEELYCYLQNESTPT